MATRVTPPAVNRCDQPYEQPQIPPTRATRQPHRGGYDCEFVKPPPVEFPQTDCPVCLLILREPHQTSCCGNSYCETCVKRVQHDKKSCPTCNETDFTIFPDKRLKRSLYALNVYCCQRREGCEWEGELSEIDRHLNLLSPPEQLLVGCQFSEVDCTYCVQSFQRRYVQAHQLHDCTKRPYTCQYCNKYATTFEDVMQNHWPVCPFFPLSCPNHCELVLHRQELHRHVSQDCPLTLIQCCFHMVGCQVQVPRRDMPSHISENLTGHMSLLQVHMMTHPVENMATYLWLMVDTIQKVLVDNANIHSELQEAQKTLRDTRDELQHAFDQLQATRDELQESHETVAQLEKTVSSQKEIIATCAKQLGQCSIQLEQHQQDTTLVHRELQEKIQRSNTQLQATVTSIEQKLQAHEVIFDQYQRSLEKMTCMGTLPFEFTMTEFEENKRANCGWYSPPFYTHTHGYRMCIRVDANGQKTEKGTHVSVSGYLMRGDFDDELQWPFQGIITIQLLNQLEDSNHHEAILNFTATKNPAIIEKVTHGEKALAGWSKLSFISHTLLAQNTTKNCQYLCDNQLKFKVSGATIYVNRTRKPTSHQL